ncbi:hypothetical protein E8E13_003089 [Curvularia kusanoi]|uniref:Fungal N-terminal domain-containing protein n=1 Tax=Curvularia kusanoi TaxID=90978 RepID=A0A9P4TC25_CURKU|nr:hypothetical protein E8E13_003089 [Curvularia kusanoi]
MAEVVGLVASAITLGATAHGAAKLSEVVFKAVSTFKNAPEEMKAIARELSLFSNSLDALADIVDRYRKLCLPLYFKNLDIVMSGYAEIEGGLKKLLDTTSSKTFEKFRWLRNKPKAQDLLKKIESTRIVLSLEVGILNLAKEINNKSANTGSTEQRAVPLIRWRSAVETIVQASRQMVEEAQLDHVEDVVEKHSHAQGIPTTVGQWIQNSPDTATQLYHLVFRPSIEDPPLQATVSDETPEEQGGLVSLRSASGKPSEKSPLATTREMIVWNSRTEPSNVVDKLLSIWTTLSHEQIRMASTQQIRHEWSDRALQLLEEVEKMDHEEYLDFLAGGTDEDCSDEVTEARRARRVPGSKSRRSSNGQPRVRFDRKSHSPIPPMAPDFSYGGLGKDAGIAPRRLRRSKRSLDRTPGYEDLRGSLTAEEGRTSKSDVNDTEGLREVVGGATSGTAASPPTGISNPPVGDEWKFVASTEQKNEGRANNTATASLGKRSVKKPAKEVQEPIRAPQAEDKQEKQPRVETDSEDDCGGDAETISVWSIDDAVPASTPSKNQRLPQENHPQSQNRPFVNNYTPQHPPPTNPAWHPFKDPSNPYLPSYSGSLPAKHPHMHPPPPVEMERLLTAQQETIAQMARSQASLIAQAGPKGPSRETGGYNEMIRYLTKDLETRNHSQGRIAADATAERKHVMITAEENLKIIHGLEQLIAQHKEDQRKAEERWFAERAELQQQADKAAKSEQNMLKDVMATQRAASEMQKSLGIVQAQVDAERRLRMENELRFAESDRRTAEENKARFERYEKLLKASGAPPGKELDTQHPIRRMVLKDLGCSIEVNEYTAGALNSNFSTLFSPFRLLLNDSWQPGNYTERDTGPRSRHQRQDGFATTIPHSSPSEMSFAGFASSHVRAGQQTILLAQRPGADNARLERLKQSLAQAGVPTASRDSLDPSTEDIVSVGAPSGSIVRSTLFWEAPVLALGSELLLTMRDMGWRLNYSRRSTGGRTYFIGDQPIHSYIFQDRFSPHFAPPTFCTQHDAVLIDKGWIEEGALIELGLEYRLASTGEYELDGRLTFSDLESLTERSDMSTIANQNNIARYESSQTSQMDSDCDRSMCGEERDVASTASASWVEKSKNPFRTLIPDTKAKTNKNPWVEDIDWDGSSLI